MITPFGSHIPEPVDFQLNADSHQELTTMVSEGRFRQDLYFRINGFSLTLPPLREYSRDVIKQLVMALLAEQQGSRTSTLDDAAMKVLRNCGWPGNIRQLTQMLEVAEEGQLSPAHLPELPAFDVPVPVARNLKTLGERLLAQALTECNSNVSAAARRLKLSRTTLYAKLKSLGLKP
ncbi:helix-turn-helix domain-containing protein [Zobellella aerophila]|uniref:Sigma-54 factor interaction domain-containing protein n=1 Tax=Zobellella aerophila TaxID=870480 RepID=A0ABP6VEC6_9GAMM